MALPSSGIIDYAPATGYHGDLIGGRYFVRGGFVREVALAAGALALFHSNGPNDEENVRGLEDGDVLGAGAIAGFCLRNETFLAEHYGTEHQVEIARQGRMRAVATAAVTARAQVYVGTATANLGNFYGAPAANRAPVPGARWESAADTGALGIIEFDFGPEPAGAGNLTLPAFAAGAIVLGDNPPNGAVYDVPATAANSTITLPADAEEGVEVEFSADGTKNGHTVQYVDATGPTNITAALTASKRHLVKARFLDGTWRASAHVAP